MQAAANGSTKSHKVTELINAGEFIEAEDLIQQIIAEQGASAQLNILLAHTRLERGMYQRSIKSANLALEYEAENHQAYYYLALAYAHLTEMLNANEAILQALSFEAANFEYLSLAAQIRLHEGQSRKARFFVEEAVTLRPAADTSLILLQAATLVVGGRNKKAVKLLHTIEVAPDEFEQDPVRHAWRVLAAGKYKQALELFRFALIQGNNQLLVRIGIRESLRAVSILPRLFKSTFRPFAEAGAGARFAVLATCAALIAALMQFLFNYGYGGAVFVALQLAIIVLLIQLFADVLQDIPFLFSHYGRKNMGWKRRRAVMIIAVGPFIALCLALFSFGLLMTGGLWLMLIGFSLFAAILPYLSYLLALRRRSQKLSKITIALIFVLPQCLALITGLDDFLFAYYPLMAVLLAGHFVAASAID